MTSDLCFAICTHRRNALLARALDSVFAAAPPARLTFEVVVIDNSDRGEAAAVIAAAAEQARRRASPFTVRGFIAHPANISIARNAAIAASGAPWFAFLDDNQRIAPDWFNQAERAVRQTSADVLFGAILPEFQTPTRAPPAARRLFMRDLDAAEGAALYALGREKTREIALTPANAVFRRQTTLASAQFDPAFASSGGEDFDLFCRLQAQGRRFLWRPSLRASEYVPEWRCDPTYLRRRFYAGGQVYAAAVAGVSPRPRAARWELRGKALAQAFWLAPRAVLSLFGGRLARDEMSYKLAGVAGKLSLGTPQSLCAEPAQNKTAAFLSGRIRTETRESGR